MNCHGWQALFASVLCCKCADRSSVSQVLCCSRCAERFIVSQVLCCYRNVSCLGCCVAADAQQCCCCTLHLLLPFSAAATASCNYFTAPLPPAPPPGPRHPKLPEDWFVTSPTTTKTTEASRGIQRASTVIVVRQAHKMPQGAGSHPAHALLQGRKCPEGRRTNNATAQNNAVTRRHKLTHQPHELACKTGFTTLNLLLYSSIVGACCWQAMPHALFTAATATAAPRAPAPALHAGLSPQLRRWHQCRCRLWFLQAASAHACPHEATTYPASRKHALLAGLPPCCSLDGSSELAEHCQPSSTKTASLA
jgi:hypothetical protein